jgi:hypothetical protein
MLVEYGLACVVDELSNYERDRSCYWYGYERGGSFKMMGERWVHVGSL